MLVVHSSSRCDVCLSEYSWETSAKRPHAIACGHIFCRDCLYTNTPPLCPLCRHVYQPNKMKRLHVDKPEDIDDQKEVDLLQRLVISWDTAPDQLDEVVTEVDLWLTNRSEEACVPLRKARIALDRQKEVESDLVATIQRLEERIVQYDAYMAQQVQHTRESYRDQINSMTKEIRDLQSQVESFQTQHYFKHSSKNPLPAPPRPILTPSLPSFEQALSESGSGARVMELPSSPMSPYHRFEVETHKKPKRKSHLSEQYYVPHDPRYQQGSSSQAEQVQHSTSSHYVQAHINGFTREDSPQVHPSRSQSQVEITNPSLDVYTIAGAYLSEYSTGFVSGHQAATSGRRKEATRGSRQPPQPVSAYEPVGEYTLPSANLYRSQPYSAPVTYERSPRTHHRRNTAQSSILSSSTSPAHDDESSSGSQSRSRSPGPRGSADSAQDLQFTNSRLASIMLGSTSGPVGSPLIRPASPLAPLSPPPRVQTVEQPPVANRPRSPNDNRNSPSAQSRRTWDSGSWGTPAPSHLTEGSLIPGLSFFRSGVGAMAYEGAQEITSFPLLNSDGESIRSRQMSIGDVGYDESTSQISRSPPRPVETMVGVIPYDMQPSSAWPHADDTHNPGIYRHAYSESNLVQHPNGWEANGHATRHARSSGYGQDEDGALPHEDRNGHSSNHLDRHARSTHEEYRSLTSFNAPVREPTWRDSSWTNDYGNGYAANGSSWAYPNEVQSLAQDDRSSTRNRTSSDENGRRSRARRALPVQSLPAESPNAAAIVDYTYSDSYGPRHNGHGSISRVVGHAEPETAAPSSFAGNALGLELAAGPTPINAPTPMVPQTFLRSWSQDH